jgi:hypothetical protein
MKDVKFILGAIRRADEEFGMIADGDHVLVGVSGARTAGAASRHGLYRRFFPVRSGCRRPRWIWGWAPWIRSDRALLPGSDIPYAVRETTSARVVFETRREKTPVRCAPDCGGRAQQPGPGDGVQQGGAGPPPEDVLETFLLSLLYEGRLSTFAPVVWMDRAGITQIRPMVYVPEKKISGAVRQLDLPVLENPCPAAGRTRRQDMKELLRRLRSLRPGAEDYMMLAISKTRTYRMWDRIADPTDGGREKAPGLDE